jgi:hypothetical protein
MTDLIFERGNRQRPVGHAFLYFTAGTGGEVSATYLVVPPIALDFGKYVPPFLAASLGSSGMVMQSAFLPVPPAPESIALTELRRLAELRGDDVITGGSAGSDIASLMARVAGIGEEYAQAYLQGLSQESATTAIEVVAEQPDEFNANALLYSVLPERERLDEIARRIPQLRYAIECSDQIMLESTRRELRAVAAYMSPRFRLDELIDAASNPDPSGARLAELYLERGYKLAGGDAEDVASLDERIDVLRGKLPRS